MYTEEIFKSADFSKETNFKERLFNKLNMIFEDGEMDEDEAANIIAARGVIAPHDSYREKKDD